MITAKQAISYYKTLGIQITLSGTRLRVVGPVTQAQRAVIAGHRTEFISALRGQDRELQPLIMTHRLAAFGLERIRTGLTYHRNGEISESFGVTHPLGDEHAGLILAGIIDDSEAANEAKARTRRLNRMSSPAPIWHSRADRRRPLSGD